jgi:hypothetical protein
MLDSLLIAAAEGFFIGLGVTAIALSVAELAAMTLEELAEYF